ncbi:fumarylacetoacetate hydrolase family protein [Microbacterium sp. KR10-403]|uniref:fumarylacetoacetate hydrolase family protein n=1 Tax=Microbacterium sp. KR10-403 TaxID=3158581 RepID=UPI0032E5152E
MKLLQFGTSSPHGRSRHLGALVEGSADDGVIVDLSAAGRVVLARDGVSAAGLRALAPVLAPDTMLAFIQGGSHTRELAERGVEAVTVEGVEHDAFGAPTRYETADIVVLPAITEPPMLRDFMAFEKHLINVFPRLGREIPEEWYRRPVYYKANTAAIGAHRQDIAFPAYADRLDLEFEFAAILAADATDVSEDEAGRLVFGYTVYDDFSARAVQALEMTVGLGPAKGKDFHAAHVLGPVVVTADEVRDPYELAMTATVNGQTWTEGTSADMHWRFEQMIAYASQGEPLRAGEVFGSGTVGDGSGAEQDRWLESGDLVELTVEGIGTLRNRVVAGGEGKPPAQRR